MRTLGLVAMAMAAVAAPGPRPQAGDGDMPLRSLNRLLRLFDFEEAEAEPHTMPINLYRYMAPDQGFPRFGSMKLTDEIAYRGRWSFGFTLEGGSLSARVPTAVLPVLPNSDYTVSVWVRTLGLEHARARLVAALHDAHGQVIPSSLVTSPLVTTRGAWRQLVVEVQGGEDRATDLVVELQVLQPKQYVPPHERGHRPLLQDVSGRVWFDELGIWQQPRLELTTGAPGNVVGPDEPRMLHLLVRDPAPERLHADLTIRGLDGSIALEERFALEPGAWQETIELDHLPGGWYRADLEVRKGDESVARRTLDLVICPPGPRRPRTDKREFGVILPEVADEDVATTIELVRRLGAGRAVVPVSEPAEAPDEEPSHDALIEGLLIEGVELAVSLPAVPEAVARATRLARHEVLALVARDAVLWRSALGPEAGDLVPAVPRWLIGRPGAVDHLTPAELSTMVHQAAMSLAEVVPGPVVLVPFWAEAARPALPSPHGSWVRIPYQARAETTAAVARRWREQQTPAPYSTTLERLPADLFAPQERVADLVTRALAAWREGVTRLSIDAPWGRDPGPRAQLAPQPSYAPWRNLGEALAGRRFGGEVPLGEGLRAWILDGAADDDALVVWNERPDGQPRMVEMLLADGPVTAVDLFGNRRSVPQDERGAQRFEVTALPVFLEGIDGSLARFRSTFAIEPAFVPARRQVHEARLVLTNPWDQTIYGTLHLDPDAAWRLTPRSHRIVIGPGEQTTFPLELVFDRGMTSGPAVIEADVELVAGERLAFRMRTSVTIGLEQVAFAAHWLEVGDDLLIRVSVTSLAAEPMNLYCQVVAPGVTHQRRPIVGLMPGQTTHRTFRLTDARKLLAGRLVSVVVSEAQGNGRANQLLHIPDLAASVATGTSPTEVGNR